MTFSYYFGASIGGYFLSFRRANQELGFESFLLAYQGRGFVKFLGWGGFCLLVLEELTTGICSGWLEQSTSPWAWMGS